MGGILSLLGGLPGLFTGFFNSVDKLTAAISNERIALINATTDRERIEIQERINSLNAQRDVLMEDSKRSSIDMWLRTAAAIAPILVISKLLAWDKVVGSLAGCVGKNTPPSCAIFTTDPIPSEQLWFCLVVYGFLFVHSMVKG